MFQKIVILALVLLVISVTSTDAEEKELILRVDGLACPFCAYGLEKKILALPGVSSYNVDMKKGKSMWDLSRNSHLPGRPRSWLFGRPDLPYEASASAILQTPHESVKNSPPMGDPFKIFFVTILASLVLQGSGPFQESYQVTQIFGGEGTARGKFIQPIGIAIDRKGNLYTSDAGNQRIQKFTPSGKWLESWGEVGEALGQLNRPMHLAFDRDERLYVAEFLNDRIQIFTQEGKALAHFGRPGKAPGELDAPGGVAIDPEGFIYVADFYNHRIQKFTPQGQFLKTIGKPGRYRRGRLHYPTDVAVDAKGNLYVADAYNHRIQKFAGDGKFLKSWGGALGMGIRGKRLGSFHVATSVSLDQEGNVFVSDFYNHRVQKFNPDGKPLGWIGSKGEGPGEFLYPTDVAIDQEGSVYVVDFGNNRIQIFKPVTRLAK